MKLNQYLGYQKSISSENKYYKKSKKIIVRNLKIDKELQQDICNKIKSGNVISLSLTGNSLSYDQLTDILKNSNNLSGVKSLSIYGNTINIESIIEVIKQSKITELYIKDCQIENDHEATEILKAMQNRNLPLNMKNTNAPILSGFDKELYNKTKNNLNNNIKTITPFDFKEKIYNKMKENYLKKVKKQNTLQDNLFEILKQNCFIVIPKINRSF